MTVSRFPPRARRWPLVGALPQLLRRRHAFLLAERARLGDCFTLELGTKPIVVLAHPRHAQHVFRDRQDVYSKKTPLIDSVRRVMGDGLVTTEGDRWLRQRKAMQAYFSFAYVQGLAPAMLQATSEALAPLEDGDLSRPLDLYGLVTRVTMRVLVESLLGSSVEPREVDRVRRAIDVLADQTGVRLIVESLPLARRRRDRRFDGALAEIDEVLFAVLERSTEAGPAPRGRAGMLTVFRGLATNATGELDRRQLRDEAITILVSGYETTAIAISWALVHLAREPAALRRAEAAVAAVESWTEPSREDLERLVCLRRATQESMRLVVPFPWLTRCAEEDDEIDGFRIPARRVVALNLHLLHHHPAIWEAPDRFDPERFTPEASSGRPELAWLPFGTGPRRCLGETFALLEAQLVLAVFLRRFRLHLAAGADPSIHGQNLISPRPRILVHVEPKEVPR